MFLDLGGAPHISFSVEFCYHSLVAVPIDINLLREEKGGNPEIVRESQRRRHASVELVDEVIELDRQWRACTLIPLSFPCRSPTGSSAL
jgi:hypothetical protein